MTPLAPRATGAYYTPGDAAAWLARWLVADEVHTVLEPSSGDGSFVDAVLDAADRTARSIRVHAVEMDPRALATLAPDARVHPLRSDFHEVEPFPVDAVIGNPPFVRFRHLDRRAAAAALAAGARAGVATDPAGSTWLSFAVHAATFLRPGGRLALVLPADALYVRYARPFWSFLAARFGSLRVVRCRERLFPDLLQDVVLLLADRAGATTAVIDTELYPARADLTSSHRPDRARIEVAAVVSGAKPFAAALLGTAHTNAMHALEVRTVAARSYAKFNIGYVAGDKSFFHPDPQVQREFRLPPASLRPALRSGRQLRRTGARTATLADDAIGALWLPDPAHLTPGEQRYVRHGESRGVHTRYKTRIRQPWYVVPGVRVPDLLLPVFGELPKLMLNDASVVASNSLVAGYWRQEVDADAFLLCWYSSVTRLGIELAVHALGGGVLVVIPGEADAIRLPVLPALPAPPPLLADLEHALCAGDLRRAYGVGDAFLAAAGWPPAELRAAATMADELLSWRLDR